MKESASIQGLLGQRCDDAAPVQFDPEDTHDDIDPVTLAVRNEIGGLLSLIGEEAADGIARAVGKVEGGVELIEQLTPLERQILGLRLAKKTRIVVTQYLVRRAEGKRRNVVRPRG
jgi:hypothetical protein